MTAPICPWCERPFTPRRRACQRGRQWDAAAARKLLVDERQHPRQTARVLPYLGPEGIGGYRKRCAEIAAKGYEGFILA